MFELQHERYKRRTGDPHDLGLAKLAWPAVPTSKIGIVCLEHDHDKPLDGRPLMVSGWGLQGK